MNQNLWKVLTPSLVIAVCLTSCQTLQTAASTGRAELPVTEVRRVPDPRRSAVLPTIAKPRLRAKPKPTAKPSPKPIAKPLAKPTGKPAAKSVPKPLADAGAKPKPAASARPAAPSAPSARPTDKPVGVSVSKPIPTTGKALSTVRRTVVAEAESYLGAPYRPGGLTRQGIDCSGLVVAVFREIGVEPPRVSGEQARFGQAVGRQDLRSGDVLFFSSSKPGVIGHSAIVTRVAEDGMVTFIHATPSRGVRYDTLDAPHWSSHYICARRYLTSATLSSNSRP